MRRRITLSPRCARYARCSERHSNEEGSEDTPSHPPARRRDGPFRFSAGRTPKKSRDGAGVRLTVRRLTLPMADVDSPNAPSPTRPPRIRSDVRRSCACRGSACADAEHRRHERRYNAPIYTHRCLPAEASIERRPRSRRGRSPPRTETPGLALPRFHRLEKPHYGENTRDPTPSGSHSASPARRGAWRSAAR